MPAWALIGLGLLAAPSAQALQYQFTTITVGDANTVSGINNHGDIAGFAITLVGGNPVYSGYTGKADGSGIAPVLPSTSFQASASGISDDGSVVGVAIDFSGIHGFLRNSVGAYSTIDPALGGLTSVYSEAIGINNAGSIVGFYTETLPPSPELAQAYSHGFTYINGVYAQFDVPAAAGSGTQINSINDSGLMTGTYLDASGIPQAFIYTPGSGFSYPVIPDGAGGTALSASLSNINSLGEYLATAMLPDPFSPLGLDATGFLFDGSSYQPFNVPGALSTLLYALNDAGQISGLYVDASGRISGFTATPVDEPGALGLLMLGTGALIRRRRRQAD